jgi:hypothetical protein
MKEAGSAFLVSSKYILPNTFDGRFQGRNMFQGRFEENKYLRPGRVRK